MKLSAQWIREFVDLSVDDRRLAEDLTGAGIAVEGISGTGADTVFEMEIGTNRPDAMNHYGVAREAAAIYDVTLKELSALSSQPSAKHSSFPITVEETQLCPRFSARVIRATTIKPSPETVARRLQLLDQRQWCGFVLPNQRAFSDQRPANTPGNRRGHRGVTQVQFGPLYCGLIGGYIGSRLPDAGPGVVVILAADGVAFDQLAVTLLLQACLEGIGLGLAQAAERIDGIAAEVIEELPAPGFAALLLSLCLGPTVIAWLKNLKFGQNYTDKAEEGGAMVGRVISKRGTPTMGGVLIVMAMDCITSTINFTTLTGCTTDLTPSLSPIQLNRRRT